MPWKISATHGLRRVGCSLRNIRGKMFSRDIPYRMRDWVTTATSVVLVIAVIAIKAKRMIMMPTGTGSTPARITSSSAAGAAARVSTGTTSAALMATMT